MQLIALSEWFESRDDYTDIVIEINGKQYDIEVNPSEKDRVILKPVRFECNESSKGPD